MPVDRWIRRLRWIGTVGMCVVVLLQGLHLGIGWFSDGTAPWFYPLIFLLEFVFIAGIAVEIYYRRRTQ